MQNARSRHARRRLATMWQAGLPLRASAWSVVTAALAAGCSLLTLAVESDSYQSADPPLSDVFLPPVIGRVATGTQIGPTETVTTSEDCAARCLHLEQFEGQQVVSMNMCGEGAAKSCQCSGWGVEYHLQENRTGCLWYRRSLPRNETPVEARVTVLARVPDKGVSLERTSLLSKAFVANIEYLRLRADVDAMLYR